MFFSYPFLIQLSLRRFGLKRAKKKRKHVYLTRSVRFIHGSGSGSDFLEFDTYETQASVILGWILVERSGFGVSRWGIAGEVHSTWRFIAFRLQVVYYCDA